MVICTERRVRYCRALAKPGSAERRRVNTTAVSRKMPSDLEEWEYRSFHQPGREGISQVQLPHVRRAVDVVFDDPNLVSCAGLVPVMRLAERVDLAGLVACGCARICPPVPIRVVRLRRSW